MKTDWKTPTRKNIMPLVLFAATRVEEQFLSAPYRGFAHATWPCLPVLIVWLYMGFLTCAPRALEKHRAFSLQAGVALWNLALSIFSVCGMLRVVPHLFFLLATTSFRDTLCMHPDHISDGVVGFWGMLFVFSKVAELMDTVFLVLRKKPVRFLHWYHHTTVLLLSWHGYAYRSSTALYFMAMNYSVHAVMYAYYFLQSVGGWPRWLSPRFITSAQIAQMGVGAWVCLQSFLYWWEDSRLCWISPSSLVPMGIVYLTYFYLFAEVFWERFLTKKTV